MGYQLRLPDALRERGVTVVEHQGWATRGSATFSARGVVCHHTGPGSPEALTQLCIRGRSDLPGPLANVVLWPDGSAHVIAAGRANHAGTGGWRGLTGNSSVFGIEAVHSGSSTQPWPDVQLEAYRRVVAGMLNLAGSGPDMCCAHKEWAPRRKPDPVGLNMDAFRASVANLILPRPPEVVRPMYDPPHVLEPIVAELTPPDGRGVWLLGASGGVYAYGGAPFYGGASGKAYFIGRRAATLEHRQDRPGYVIRSTTGEPYAYPE